MNCPNCGEHMAIGAEVCMECGKPLKGGTVPGFRPAGMPAPPVPLPRPAPRSSTNAKPRGAVMVALFYGIRGAMDLTVGGSILSAGDLLTGATHIKPLPMAPGATPAETIARNLEFARILGTVYLLLAAFDFLIAWGVYNIHHWARAVAIVFAILGFVSVFALMRSQDSLTVMNVLLSVYLNIRILYYMLGHKATVEAFQ